MVNYNLNKLVTAGYLTRSSHVSRGLRLTSAAPTNEKKSSKKVVSVSNKALSIYKVGYIFASNPVPVPDEAHFSDEDKIEVTSSMLKGNDPEDVYALEVKGDL